MAGPGRADSWLARNRKALIALVPLGIATVIAGSYQYRTFYLPNDFTNVRKAKGQEIAYSEHFTEAKTDYDRAVSIRLVSATSQPLRANPAFTGVRPVGWTVSLQFAARPDVPLDMCRVALVDAEGRVYSGAATGCVPRDRPGPRFGFDGKLEPADGEPRPAQWPVEAKVVMPADRKPVYVRVAWKEPNAALLPLR